MTEREHNRGEGPEPLDEEAAWAQIVAAYGEEPADPPDVRPLNGHGSRGDHGDGNRDGDGDGGEDGDGAGAGAGNDETGAGNGRGGGTGSAEPPTTRTLTVYAAGSGPRDWRPAEPSDDEDDEGHFVPPEPPPLPKGDTVSRAAWAAVLGGPLLLVLTVLFQQDVTWWITTLGIGGFLGGFATLVTRLRDDDDDGFDDPGRGAVV